ncbi:MAG: hypothetical protein KDD64_01795 [Bdellovibrionales bacterium]|nr:hypothetical protein [Bdellovibrionales bacterium]
MRISRSTPSTAMSNPDPDLRVTDSDLTEGMTSGDSRESGVSIKPGSECALADRDIMEEVESGIVPMRPRVQEPKWPNRACNRYPGRRFLTQHRHIRRARRLKWLLAQEDLIDAFTTREVFFGDDRFFDLRDEQENWIPEGYEATVDEWMHRERERDLPFTLSDERARYEYLDWWEEREMSHAA